MQTKGCTLAVKDVDNAKGIVSGYFSSFDNKDSDGDIIRKGAYSKTVTERGPLGTGQIKHLLQHNRNQPIGKILELREDDRGLFFTSQLSKSTLGQDTLIQYQEGIYNEHSVGFFPIKQAFSKADDANVITEIKLLEGSTVTWGANAATPVTGIKSFSEGLLLIKTELAQLQKLLAIGSLSDETLKALEEQYAQVVAQYNLVVKMPMSGGNNEPAPGANRADLSFAQKMIPHHAMAIEMASLLIKNGESDELKDFAKKIKSTQSAEIEWLKDWISNNTNNKQLLTLAKPEPLDSTHGKEPDAKDDESIQLLKLFREQIKLN